jgi:hypothetical protein
MREFAFWFEDKNTIAEYAVTRDKYMGAVIEQIKAWRARWVQYSLRTTADQVQCTVMPKLVFVPKDNGVVVYDSRLDSPVELPISDLQTRILESLSIPKSASDVADDLGLTGEIDLHVELETLLQWGLVFQENQTYLSLVEGSHAYWDTMTTRELMSSLEVLDLKLWIEDGTVKYRAAPGVLTDTIRQELTKRRMEIVHLLPEIQKQRENNMQMIASHQYQDRMYIE